MLNKDASINVRDLSDGLKSQRNNKDKCFKSSKDMFI